MYSDIDLPELLHSKVYSCNGRDKTYTFVPALCHVPHREFLIIVQGRAFLLPVLDLFVSGSMLFWFP